MEELDIKVLTDEAVQLLQMDIDELYTTLGAQLLGYALPIRTAGMVSYLSAIRIASTAKTFYSALPSEPALTEWAKGVGVILDELKRQGIAHFAKVRAELKKALCNHDLMQFADQMNRSTIQIIILIVGATLRMPRELDPLCVTITAIILKMGLQNFCDQS